MNITNTIKKEDCPSCNGKGKRPCTACKGTGLFVHGILPLYGQFPFCCNCGGSGKEICPNCKGSGKK